MQFGLSGRNKSQQTQSGKPPGAKPHVELSFEALIAALGEGLAANQALGEGGTTLKELGERLKGKRA
jgi:hypothetical protein